VITVEGLGPYRTGASAAGLVRRTGDVTCAVWYEATRPYDRALVSVRVRDGAIRSIIVRSSAYATASGARVGMAATELRRIYGNRLQHLDGADLNYPGGGTVRVGGRSVAFQLDERARVVWIGAGSRVDAESIVTDVEHYPC
jgi:hypothetical protein